MKPAQLALKLLVLFISLLPSQLLATSQDLEAIAETQTEHMIERVIAENSETWGSSSPEEWLETTGQSEAAVQSSLIRYNSFQALEGSYLSSLARTELYAFDIYSGFGYQHINSFFFSQDTFEQAIAEIRRQFLDQEDFRLIEVPLLIRGLNKTPRFSGRLFRSAFSPASTSREEAMVKAKRLYNSQPVQSTYTFKGFMSTTKGTRSSAREAYVDNALLLLIIDSNKGHDIELLSNRPHEEEVLFLPFSSFKVENREEIKDATGAVVQYRLYLKDL